MSDMKHFLHRSQGALREIFLTLGKTVQDTFLSKLKQAAHFGLLVDDLTDISVTEQMISFTQFYNKSGRAVETGSCPLTTFWKIHHRQMQVPSLTALLKPWISSVSDGAAVMTGSRSGVATKLKELNPQLINFHCICGNCEEELPKKPVGRLSVNCGRQLTNRLQTANQQVTDS